MPASHGPLFILFILGGMILTGYSDSLWSKFQDMQCVENCSDPNPKNHIEFKQPVLQTLQMFVGQMLCFLPVVYKWLKLRRQSVDDQTDSGPDLHRLDSPLQGWKILLLWIPAACDLTGATLMNVGLLYTPVSIFQMTRRSALLFLQSIFSVVFFSSRLRRYQWISLVILMTGIALVGYSASLIQQAVEAITLLLARALGNHNDDSLIHSSAEEPEFTHVLVGVFFILFAQVFIATRYIVEDMIVARYPVSPLVAVGYEGLFGTLSILLFAPILAIPSISALSPFFDLLRGWYQMINTPAILYSSIAICLSVSLFNIFDLSVTSHRDISRTLRCLVDIGRTLSIWFFSLGFGWEKLLFPISVLQILGFSLFVYGMFLFNNLVKPPPFLEGPHVDTPAVSHSADEEAALLSEPPLEETATPPDDLGQGGFNISPAGHVIPKGDARTSGPSYGSTVR